MGLRGVGLLPGSVYFVPWVHLTSFLN